MSGMSATVAFLYLIFVISAPNRIPTFSRAVHGIGWRALLYRVSPF
jgi:hypothetical protein